MIAFQIFKCRLHVQVSTSTETSVLSLTRHRSHKFVDLVVELYKYARKFNKQKRIHFLGKTYLCKVQNPFRIINKENSFCLRSDVFRQLNIESTT